MHGKELVGAATPRGPNSQANPNVQIICLINKIHRGSTVSLVPPHILVGV
jgi:hypothetical protein